MTFLVTADLHFSDNPRDAYRFQIIKTLRRLIAKYDVEALLILGDLTEEKDRHGAWLVNKIVDSMQSLAERCPVVILKGNHDYITADSPFYGFLKHIHGITWVNAPETGEGLSAGFPAGLKDCLFLPHTPDPDRDWKQIKLTDYRWIFAHQTFEGARGENGRHLEGGISTSELFDAGTQIISGDVHVPQKLGNLRYCGAPYTVDFGDSYQPRLLLIDGDRVRSIKLGGAQKRLVEIHDIKELSGAAVTEGDIVKVRFHLAASEYSRWPELQQQVRVWGKKRKLQIHMVQPMWEGVEKKKRKRTTAPKQTDDIGLLRAYAKERGIDASTLKTGEIMLKKI